MPRRRVEVEGATEPLVVLEAEIKKISAATNKLLKGPLTEEAVFHLVAWKAGITKPSVRTIMKTLADLDKVILKKKKAV